MLDSILEALILIVVFLEYIESMKMRQIMQREEQQKQGQKQPKNIMGDRIGF